MMTIKFKCRAKFGNIVMMFAKFNKIFLEIKGRCGCTNGNWSECELRGMSFHHYGNPLGNSNYFLIKSMNDIIKQNVKDLRCVKIMILYIHDYHNFFALDIEIYQARVCKIIILFVKGLKVGSSCGDIPEEKVQMHITEEGELEIGGIDMGGDLNRMEPTKIENFKDRMAT